MFANNSSFYVVNYNNTMFSLIALRTSRIYLLAVKELDSYIYCMVLCHACDVAIPGDISRYLYVYVNVCTQVGKGPNTDLQYTVSHW